MRQTVGRIAGAKNMDELCALAPPKIKLFRCANYTTK